MTLTLPMRSPDPAVAALRRRLRPLHAAVFLQGFMLWVSVEKLFMTELGFDAASIGVMAAAYSALVPLLELPTGILADRWSRRGVLILSSVAISLGALLGGLSQNVTMYVISALLFGVYVACYSGTLDSVVYDTVLEETGDGGDFQRRIGRVQAVEAVALVASALAGGWVAGLLEPRVTYFLTVPFALASIAGYARFREPRLHRSAEPVALRRHLGLTVRAVTRRRQLLPIVTLGVLAAVISQLVFEFGPLWLVALAVPAAAYGPYWAGLVSTLGFGGLLAGRLRLDRPVNAWLAAGAMTVAALLLTADTGLVAVTAAQVTLALLTGLAAIHVSAVLHDAVPSAIRSGVASGVSSLSWLAFLPVALGFGALSTAQGVHRAGWVLVALAVLAGTLLAATARSAQPAVRAVESAGPAAEPAAEVTAEPALARAC
jgi:MFS family permease